MFSRLAAVCTWLAWTKIVPLLLLIAVTALAAPAHAISIEDFFDPLKGFSSDVRHGAERTALTTEAYRNLKAGHAARAACIEEELIPKGRWDASGFDGLQAHLVEARDSGDKRLSVEDLIINAENVACPVENPEQYPSRVFSATSVREFYAKFPTGSDKVQILSIVFSTQALRTARAGYRSRGQCITDKLVVSRMANGDFIVPLEFQRATGRLANAETLEKQMMDSIIANCGEEKP